MAYAVTTVGAIIRSAMRKIGVLAMGEPLPPDQGNDALIVFRQMTQAWTLESLLIPVVSVVTKQLYSSISDYTIGIYPEPKPNPLPDSHIETPRPEKILSAFIRDASGTDYIQSIIDVEMWSYISVKDNQSRPGRFYVEKGWPLNTIKFEALPYDNEFLHLSVLQPFSGVLPSLGLDEEINLPEGYEKALVYNLAIELAPEWGKDPRNDVVAQAVNGKRLIKQANSRKITLKVDRALATQRRGIGTYIISQGP